MPRGQTPSSPFRAAPILQSLLIVAAAWFVFAPVFRAGWLWDDDLEILNNRLVLDPAGLPKIWIGSGERDFLPLKATANWIQWRLWGPHPLGYHLTNIGLHVVGAFLFWRLLRKLGVKGAWWGGLLLVVHPLTVESVAWISELKNTLSLAFLLLAMSCYLDFDTGPERGARCAVRLYLGSIGLFLAAMLCKTSVAMFPVVLLLYAWWRRRRITRRDLWASSPFFAISLVLGCVTVWFQTHRTDLGATLHPGGFLGRFGEAGLALGFYLFKCVWPVNLMPIYLRWPMALSPIWPALAWGSIGALAGWLWTKRTAWGRAALFGFGCFAANLLPVLGFIPMSFLRLAPVSDHLAYVALLGVLGLAAAAGGAIYERTPARLRFLAGAAALALCALLSVRSRRYARNFRDDIALWTYAAQRNPNTWAAPTNLAIALESAGRMPEALAQYQVALRLNPKEPTAHFNLGNALRDAGRLPEAIAQFEQAVQLDPNFTAARGSLGVALTGEGQWPAAVAQLEAALRLQPGDAVIHYDLGNALSGEDQQEAAAAQYEQALRLKPDYAAAHNNLGSVLAAAGRLPEAIAQDEAALRLDPANAEVRNNLANALRQAGRGPEAIVQYEEAVRLRPDLAAVHFNLAVSLAEAGRPMEAIPQYEQTLRLQPDFPGAGEGLAEARRAWAQAATHGGPR